MLQFLKSCLVNNDGRYASLILQIWEMGGTEKSRMYNNTVYRETGTIKKIRLHQISLK
jgi:hypothetical protein